MEKVAVRYLGRYIKQLTFLLFCSLLYVSDVLALDFPSYTREEWEKIVIVVGIIITLASPPRYRVGIIGTVLGLVCSYFTYKYLVLFLI